MRIIHYYSKLFTGVLTEEAERKNAVRSIGMYLTQLHCPVARGVREGWRPQYPYVFDGGEGGERPGSGLVTHTSDLFFRAQRTKSSQENEEKSSLIEGKKE